MDLDRRVAPDGSGCEERADRVGGVGIGDAHSGKAGRLLRVERRQVIRGLLGGLGAAVLDADPLNASSGTLTMSLIISEYAREHGGAGDLSATAATPGFAAYLSQVNRAYVRDPSAVGSSALEKAYVSDPKSRDFITAYESAALAAVEQNPDLVMVYPSPTAVADQSAVLLSAPWTSDAQKTTARAFLDFLSKPEALDDGVQYYFRPSQNGAQTLSARLGPNAKAQFQSSYAQIELPPYDALNEAAAQWRTETK